MLSFFGVFDFLLAFNFGAGAAARAAWLKNAEMEESTTAKVWVKVPGFIRHRAQRPNETV